MYICKLFDSILRGYPIGGLIVWNTDTLIPYREFIKDYVPGEWPKLVDIGLHGRRDKWLVYDGQQRLQTLYSCLKYTFNEKVLIYDLLFDLKSSHDPDETGFLFVPKNTNIDWHFIRMNTLFSKLPEDEKADYRNSIKALNDRITAKEEAQLERSIDALWDIFVKTDKKSLAYFPVNTTSSRVVNEIFERLNTGGRALNQADLLFSKIKGDAAFDFEENLQICSKQIYDSTGKGYLFSAYNILQLLNLLIKDSVRIDPDRVRVKELSLFAETWTQVESPLLSFFTDYLWGQFKINNASIVPRQIALLPILVYFYEVFSKGFLFKHISGSNLQKINQYFIKSQVNDWNLQTYADNFAGIIKKVSSNTQKMFDFPLIEIEAFISKRGQREITVTEERFAGYLWFSLKVLTPERIYQYEPDMKGRFNPEIDHVFPKKLAGRSADHERGVDIIWNMQPTKGEINAYKTNIHPKVFFLDQAVNKNGDTIIGSKYLSEYDFLFPQLENKKIDFNNPVWDSPIEFIQKRKELMIEFLRTKYAIGFYREPTAPNKES